MFPTTHRRRPAGDEGAAAVEFALLLPLFILLVFGMISSGFAFERWINATQAAHEGSRYGATLSLLASAPGGGNPDTWVAKVAAATKESAGFDPAPPGQYVCVSLTQVTSAGVATSRKAVDTSSGLVISDGTCYASVVSGDRVQTVVKRDTTFDLVFSSGTITVGGESQTRWEAK